MRISDWSSDVCSSDLRAHAGIEPGPGIANAGIGAECRREVLGEKRLELVVELVDPKIDRLGAAHQPVDLGKLLAKSIELRSEEHTSELQSLMRISYAVFCLKKKKKTRIQASWIIQQCRDN